VLDRAVDKHPSNPALRAARAAALERAGERDEALADWRAAADLAPADHRPLLGVARLLAAAGKFDDAVAVAEAAVVRGTRVLPPVVQPASAAVPTPMPPAVTLPARTDPLTGQVVPAVAVAPVALPVPAAGPTLWCPDEVLAAQGEVLARAGHWGDAIPRLEAVAARRPADAAAKLALGRALLAWMRYDDAERAFADAHALAPASVEARAGLGYAKAAQNQPGAAEPHLTAALAAAPDDPLARAGRAHLRFHAGDFEAALADALAGLAAEPRSLDRLGLTARLLLATDRPTAAVLVLSKALELPMPDTTRANLLLGRGTAWVRAGSPPAAEKDAGRALALDPADANPHAVLGQAAEHRQDYTAAASHYAAAVAADPKHPEAGYRLAMLRASAPDRAVRDPAAALALADKMPAGPHADAVRGLAHAAAGRFGPAVAALDAALAAVPADHDERGTLVRLRDRFRAGRAFVAGDTDD
jgi:Flp pilus assembly protein TadD